MAANQDRGHVPDLEAAELFRANLGLIDRVIDRVCRNAHLQPADAEDFASTVKLALIEDDYAILRAWQQRASLHGYLLVVTQRLLLDERVRTRGRFEPSAEARRGGKAGILLETLVRRDGRPLEQVIPLVQAADLSLTRRDIEMMAERLPERKPRPRSEPVDDVDVESMRASDGAEAAVAESEAARLSEKASHVVRLALAMLPREDRAVVRMHFGSGMGIAEISRVLRLPQRPLYRRVQASLSHLRRALVAAGIDAATAEGMIGSAVQSLDFGLHGKSDPASRSTEHGRPDTGGDV